MSTQTTTPPGQITLKNVRLAYVHIDKPWAKKGDDQSKAKYCLSVILDKTDPQIAPLTKVLKEVATAKWGDAYTNKKMKPIFCLRDGAERDHKEGFDDTKKFFNAARRPEEGPPVVRNLKNQNLDPIKNAAEWPYSGCFGHVVLKFWAQDNVNGQRVNAEIVAVVKCADGEKFGGDNSVNVDEALTGLVEQEDLPGLTSTTYAKPTDIGKDDDL